MINIKSTASLSMDNLCDYLIDKSFQDQLYFWHSLLVVTRLSVQLIEMQVIHHILQKQEKWNIF